MSAEKRHEPTKKRLREARLEGQTARSQAFTQLFSLVGGIVGFLCGACFGWVSNRTLLKCWAISGSLNYAVPGAAAVSFAVGCILPSLALSSLGAVLAETLQVGVCVSFRPAAPRLERISPQAGFRRTAQELKNPWPHLLGIAGSVWAAFLILKNFWRIFAVGLKIEKPLEAVVMALKLVIAPLTFGLLIYVVLDRFARAAAFRRRLRMSDDELKRENREEEGSPEMRAFRRSRQMEAAFSNILAQIRKSKVIILDRQAKDD